MNEKSDVVLVTWLICSLLWDISVFGAAAYLVFWKDHSGWIFVLALIICYQPMLLKILRKRYEIKED